MAYALPSHSTKAVVGEAMNACVNVLPPLPMIFVVVPSGERLNV